ncbi:hypothetical protein [Erwinia sp. SLM-02]|uniref:hypothetical protein n=1 Tax=Erwinia sp. SLM-02 TaxID=3020057 RepID=UPI00308094DB
MAKYIVTYSINDDENLYNVEVLSDKTLGEYDDEVQEAIRRDSAPHMTHQGGVIKFYIRVISINPVD